MYKYTGQEVLIFKKKIYCDNILKWTKNFYYLFLEYLILHYQTAVVVLRHMEIVMVLCDHKIHDGYLRSLHGVGTLKAQGLRETSCLLNYIQ